MDSFNYFVKACSWLKTDFLIFLQCCFIIAPVLWNLAWHKAKCFRNFFFYIPPKPSFHQIIYSYNFDKRRATITFYSLFYTLLTKNKEKFPDNDVGENKWLHLHQFLVWMKVPRKKRRTPSTDPPARLIS